MHTRYLVTWAEGIEVFYKFVNDNELKKWKEADRNYMITPLTV